MDITFGGITVRATSYSEFPRGEDGLCAFCSGDPLAEEPDAAQKPIGRYHTANPWADTCPCCDGRPS